MNDYKKTPWQPHNSYNSSTWNKNQIKRSFLTTLGKMLQNDPKKRGDIEVSYLKAQHVQWGRISDTELPTMWASQKQIKDLCVKSGDLLVCEGGEAGRSAVVERETDQPIIVQNALHLVRNRNGADVRFLMYLLYHASNQNWFDVICNKATITHFTVEKFSDMWSWMPRSNQQTKIADFLDREASKIDTLIEKNRTLIERLQEKRTTLISQIVTKGLNPEVTMKDSGIEWLGEVPEHWEKVPLRYCASRIRTGSTPPTLEEHYFEDGTIPWYGPSSFDEQITLKSSTKLLNKLAVKDGVVRVYKPGSSLVVTIGATLGKVSSLEKSGSCNQQITAIEFDRSDLNPRFMTYQIKRLESFLRAIAPSATLPILDQQDIADIRMILPPLKEQVVISMFLDTETAKIDNLISKIESVIERLLERRSTLISTAVTGQIDVNKIS